MAELLARGLALAVGVALLLVTADAVRSLAVASPERGPALRLVLQLVVLGLAWLLVNAPVEGPVLWVWQVGHGLTAADVLSAPPLLLAGLLLLRRASG